MRHQSITLSCQTCAKPFTVANYRRQSAKFCSHPCYAKDLAERARDRLMNRFWSKVEKTNDLDGCWLWNGSLSNRGYGFLTIATNATVLAHRFSYALAFGAFDNRLFVCHKCDRPACVRPSHLFLGTEDDNMRDMAAKQRTRWKSQGRKPKPPHTADRSPEGLRRYRADHPDYTRGELSGQHKLTEHDVRRIRELHSTTRTADLAHQFAVSTSLIRQIIQRVAWSHVT